MSHTALEAEESESNTCHKSWKGPVDPASYEDHGKHVGDISLHHVCQHAGICLNTQCEWAEMKTNSLRAGLIVSLAG